MSGAGDAVTVFVSYAREDEALKDELLRHLAGLMRSRLIDVWHDRRIADGGAWEKEIDRRLEAAEIIVVLVSPALLASEFCWKKEVPVALRRFAGDAAKVIPVIVERCAWRETELGKLQARPRDGRPVVEWPVRDAAWDDVAGGVEACARGVIAERSGGGGWGRRGVAVAIGAVAFLGAVGWVVRAMFPGRADAPAVLRAEGFAINEGAAAELRPGAVIRGADAGRVEVVARAELCFPGVRPRTSEFLPLERAELVELSREELDGKFSEACKSVLERARAGAGYAVVTSVVTMREVVIGYRARPIEIVRKLEGEP